MDAGIQVTLANLPEAERVLTREALTFVAELHRRFNPTRQELLARRDARQQQIASDQAGFLDEARAIREADWTVAPAPADLNDRRVESPVPATAR